MAYFHLPSPALKGASRKTHDRNRGGSILPSQQIGQARPRRHSCIDNFTVSDNDEHRRDGQAAVRRDFQADVFGVDVNVIHAARQTAKRGSDAWPITYSFSR
jgi:hypothetical protein